MFVGIAGAGGAGKDTAGLFFKDMGFTKVNFADNLKRMCSHVFDIPLQYFYDTTLKGTPIRADGVVINLTHLSKMSDWIGRTHNIRIPVTPFLGKRLLSPKEMMHYVGTDIIRAVRPDYHVEATIPIMAECDKLVCSDISFPNELDGIKRVAAINCAEFISIYVRRQGCNAEVFLQESSVRPDMCQYIIDNNGSIENLHRTLKRMFAGRLREPELVNSRA